MSGGNNSYVNLYKFDYDMLDMNMVGLKLKLTLNWRERNQAHSLHRWLIQEYDGSRACLPSKVFFGDCEENQVQKVNIITKVFVCVIAHLVDHLVNNIVATMENTHIQTLLITTIHAVATPYEKNSKQFNYCRKTENQTKYTNIFIFQKHLSFLIPSIEYE